MKQILALIIGLILAVSLVAAMDRSPDPHPFVLYFRYGEEIVEGLKVEFTVNDETVIKETNENGGVMIDLDLGYSPDFRIGRELNLYYEVLKVDCGFEVCNQNYRIGLIFYPFEVTYNLKEVAEVETIICPDGTEVIKGTKCPEIPEPKVITKIICGDGTEVDNIEDCIVPPDKDINWVDWIIKIVIALLIATGVGTGWKFYQGRSEAKIHHRHPGIRGYHDPNNRHKKKEIRHALWKDSPWKCIKDTKKIQQTGSVL